MPRQQTKHGPTIKKATGRTFVRRNDMGDALDFIGWYNDTSNKRLGLSKSDAYSLYLATTADMAAMLAARGNALPLSRAMLRRPHGRPQFTSAS